MLVALAMLRRRINSHESPIYRLHPELLSLIASYLVPDDLVEASHISYHWRTVLLSYPSLWTTLDFTHPERALTFLARSKSAPIRAFLQWIRPNAPLPIELLDQPAERIVTLSVGDYPSQKELLLRTMPSLRTLEFHPDPYDIPLDEFETIRWHFPALRTLSVQGIDPPPFSAPHLTRFVYCSWRGGDQTMDALLDFLCKCPLLEEIEINQDNDFYTRSNHDVVHLPHLRVYTHFTTTYLYLSLYNMLSCPPSCSVTFRCGEGYAGTSDSFLQFKNPTFIVYAKRVKLESRAVDHEGYAEGIVEIIDTAHRRFRSTRQVVMEDGSTWDGALTDNINPLFLGCLKGLDPRPIEVLCVDEPALWLHEVHDHIEEALGHLEHIKMLILCCSVVGTYLRVLAPTEATDIGGLRCLELDTLVIRSRSHVDGSGNDIISAVSFFARRRKAAGIPLKKVSLFLDWMPTPRDLKDLEELRGCIGTLEYVMEDVADALLDWNVDDYFLGGLDHLRIDTYYEICIRDRYDSFS